MNGGGRLGASSAGLGANPAGVAGPGVSPKFHNPRILVYSLIWLHRTVLHAVVSMVLRVDIRSQPIRWDLYDLLLAFLSIKLTALPHCKSNI